MEPAAIDAFEHEGVRMRWEPRSRTVEMDFVGTDMLLTEELARVLIRRVDDWVAGGPFKLLVDSGAIAEADAGWRAAWADFFRRRRARVRVAWYRPRPLLRTIIRMFILGTRLDGGTFATREEARAWLDELAFAEESHERA